MEETKNELCTSITEINNSLIVSLNGEMTDENISGISDIITERAYRNTVNGAILNFSMVSVLDSYTYTAFKKITKALSLMGVRTVWVGLRPGVVSALMDLNVEIDTMNICAAVNLEQGLEILATPPKAIAKGGRK